MDFHSFPPFTADVLTVLRLPRTWGASLKIRRLIHVRFTPKRGHSSLRPACPLGANSGHRAAIDPFSAGPDFPAV
jgi:hypothetical protein